MAWTRKPHTQRERIEAWLGGSDLHHLLNAKEALEQPGVDAETLLRSLVQRDAQRYRRATKQLRLSLLLMGIAALALFCEYVISPGIAGRVAVYLLLVFWLLAPCMLSWLEEYRTHGRRLGNAVALLHRLPLASSTAEMIDALDAGREQTTALAAKNLIQHLPDLPAKGGFLLTTKHHRALRRALRGYDSDLILAILHASDKLLNATAIPEVRWLTKCPDWIAESEQIQAAARQTLPALEAQSRQRYTVHTLLRPSHGDHNSEKELLHPVTSVPAVVAHEMLRADHAPSASEYPTPKYPISTLCVTLGKEGIFHVQEERQEEKRRQEG